MTIADGRRVLVVKSGGPAAFADWCAAFSEFAPFLEVRPWSDPGALAEIDYTMVWEPDFGRIAAMPNLRLVLSSAVGVEHILADPTLPHHLPILRTAPPEAADQMAEYVVWAVLHLHREIPRFEELRRRREWGKCDPPLARDRRVGVLGLGAMGARSAAALAALGFAVSGWSRTPKALPGIDCHAGREALPRFLGGLDIVVCLLPATAETAGILDAAGLALLRRGAMLVNAARGVHVPTPDLIAALDAGHVSWAVLDVLEPEPPAPDDPVWTHPRIVLTPHIASLPSRRDRARFAAAAIAAFERGERLPTLYDPVLGY